MSVERVQCRMREHVYWNWGFEVNKSLKEQNWNLERVVDVLVLEG